MRPQSPKTDQNLADGLAAFIKDLRKGIARDTCRNCNQRTADHTPQDRKCLFGPGTFEPTVLKEE